MARKNKEWRVQIGYRRYDTSVGPTAQVAALNLARRCFGRDARVRPARSIPDAQGRVTFDVMDQWGDVLTVMWVEEQWVEEKW